MTITEADIAELADLLDKGRDAWINGHQVVGGGLRLDFDGHIFGGLRRPTQSSECVFRYYQIWPESQRLFVLVDCLWRTACSLKGNAEIAVNLCRVGFN